MQMFKSHALKVMYEIKQLMLKFHFMKQFKQSIKMHGLGKIYRDVVYSENKTQISLRLGKCL